MFLYHRQHNCSTSIQLCINSSIKTVTEVNHDKDFPGDEHEDQVFVDSRA